MGPVNGKFPAAHRTGRFERHQNLLRGYGAPFRAVLVEVLAVPLLHCLEIFVDDIDAAGGMHPAGTIIETLINEELSPGGCTVRIQSLLANHLQFRPEIKARVRINEEQRMMIGSANRSDGHPV